MIIKPIIKNFKQILPQCSKLRMFDYATSGAFKSRNAIIAAQPTTTALG